MKVNGGSDPPCGTTGLTTYGKGETPTSVYHAGSRVDMEGDQGKQLAILVVSYNTRELLRSFLRSALGTLEELSQVNISAADLCTSSMPKTD